MALIAVLKRYPTGDVHDSIASALVEIAFARPVRAADTLDKLITRRYRLDQINEACDDLHHGKILGRAILDYE